MKYFDGISTKYFLFCLKDEFSTPKDWNEIIDKLCHGNFILSTSFQHFLNLLIENIKEGSIWEQVNEK